MFLPIPLVFEGKKGTTRIMNTFDGNNGYHIFKHVLATGKGHFEMVCFL